MKKTIHLLFTVISFIILFSSCEIEPSSTVPQEKIYTSYSVIYNENTGISTVQAEFRLGDAQGALLELTPPAQVLFEEEPLLFNPLTSSHFLEVSEKISKGNFVYTNNDGTVFENTMPFVEPIGIPNTLNQISKSQDTEIIWEGDAISENQQVAVFLGRWNSKKSPLAFVDKLQASMLSILSDNIATEDLGTTTMYLDRLHTIDHIDAPRSGGQIQSRYRAINQLIEIID